SLAVRDEIHRSVFGDHSDCRHSAGLAGGMAPAGFCHSLKRRRSCADQHDATVDRRTEEAGRSCRTRGSRWNPALSDLSLCRSVAPGDSLVKGIVALDANGFDDGSRGLRRHDPIQFPARLVKEFTILPLSALLTTFGHYQHFDIQKFSKRWIISRWN